MTLNNTMNKLAFFKSKYKAKKNKKWKKNNLYFLLQAEKNLLELQENIKQKKYYIKPSLCFINFHPIKREIMAGDFSDRVVHHIIFNALSPHYDPLFINDAYSCRKNKGTSYGIKRAKYFMRKVSDNYKKKAYVMKLDIKGYFMSIDQNILYHQNKILVKKYYSKQETKKNTLLYLLKKIIFNEVTMTSSPHSKSYPIRIAFFIRGFLLGFH